jgi:hypothetical protein
LDEGAWPSVWTQGADTPIYSRVVVRISGDAKNRDFGVPKHI